MLTLTNVVWVLLLGVCPCFSFTFAVSGTYGVDQNEDFFFLDCDRVDVWQRESEFWSLSCFFVLMCRRVSFLLAVSGTYGVDQCFS